MKGRGLAGVRHPEWLITSAVAALFVFYYFLRADVVGVFSGPRGWTATTASPLAPTLHFVLAAVVLGVLPVAVARWGIGIPLRDLGLGLGSIRKGLGALAIGVPLAVIAGKLGAAAAGQRAVYPLDPSVSGTLRGFAPYALLQFLYFGSWEVLFRGVLLFGLRGRLGEGAANLVQTGLSVTAHFGRSLGETLSAFPAGLLFGWVSLRLGSIWYVAVIHWVTGVSQDWFILHR